MGNIVHLFLFVYECIFVIDMVHVSLSVMSIFVIAMPFILLVIIQKAVLHVSARRDKDKK